MYGDDGYWLVDESGKKLIYVRPNATGHYADSWRQFIGAVTLTSIVSSVPRGGLGHGVRRSWRRGKDTQRSNGIMGLSSSGKLVHISLQL